MSQPYRFQVTADGNVTRIDNQTGQSLTVFRAASKAQGEAFLQVYLTLSIDDRRKLRAAVAP
jgi:hypothetical protein